MVVTPQHVIESANRCGRSDEERDATLVLAEHRGVWLECIQAGRAVPEGEFERVRLAALALGKTIDPYRWHVRRHLVATCNIIAGLDEYVSWGGTPEDALAWLAEIGAYAKVNQTRHIGLAASLVKLGVKLDEALANWTEDTEDDDLHEISWWAGWHQWAATTARLFREPDCHERGPAGYACWKCYDCTLFMDGGNEGGPALSGSMSPTGALIGPSPRHDTDRLTIRRYGNEWMFRRLQHALEAR